MYKINTLTCEYFMKIERISLMVPKYGVPVSLKSRARCQLLTRISASPEKIDLVVTLGGDGTILHASSLFSSGAVPPVLSFSMGTLGFLLPFRVSQNPYILLSSFHLKSQISTTSTRLWRVYFQAKLPF